MKRDELIKYLEGAPCIKTNIFLWGTGNTANLYQEGIERLKQEGFDFVGYVDNNSSKWGEKLFNKTIYSPNYLETLNDVYVFILSPQVKVIRAVGKQLSEMNIPYCTFDEYVLKTHKNEVLECYDLFEDEISRDTYAELVRCRICADYPADELVSKGQYFAFRDFGEYVSGEVFLDCGAFVGDTLEAYISSKGGVFSKIIAFEPDERNFDAIQTRVNRIKKEWNLEDEKIEIVPYGISDTSNTKYVQRYDNNNGLGSKIISDKSDIAQECKVVSIDEFVDGKVGFIKADIESYEYRLIIGAQNMIKSQSPKMAICIYHNVVDFYQIPLLLKEINPNYRFAVRHYTHVLSDTVLYAYVRICD